MENVSEASKFNFFVNHIDTAVYELIAEATGYEKLFCQTLTQELRALFLLVMHSCPVSSM